MFTGLQELMQRCLRACPTQQFLLDSLTHLLLMIHDLSALQSSQLSKDQQRWQGDLTRTFALSTVSLLMEAHNIEQSAISSD